MLYFADRFWSGNISDEFFFEPDRFLASRALLFQREDWREGTIMLFARAPPFLRGEIFISGIYFRSRWEYEPATALRERRLNMSRRTHHNASKEGQRMESIGERLEAMEQRARMMERWLRWWRILTCALLVLGLVILPLVGGTAQEQSAYERALVRRLAALEYKLQYITGGPNEVVITGANLRIVNGLGATDTTNGLGNLIVGYNESRIIAHEPDVRTGSHNVVVGDRHNFSSFGGLVVGFFNEISGNFASVSGGHDSTASGDFSSVSGGAFNTASGDFGASVSGGNNNTATGMNASVSGGFQNTASGDFFASVSGGRDNTASGESSSVSGGLNRTAPGEFNWAAGPLFAAQ